MGKNGSLIMQLSDWAKSSDYLPSLELWLNIIATGVRICQYDENILHHQNPVVQSAVNTTKRENLSFMFQTVFSCTLFNTLAY